MKIELKNFQAHSNSSLDIRGGLVCVVGQTNAGKSSIIRALRSLIYDSIRGNRFVRHGQTEAMVQVQFDDVAVAKVKGKKTNRYIVGGEKYDAIGVGIPVEAARALNMPLIRVDKDLDVELHISSQLNPPFLILDNDSTRAKFLNVLTGGHILDAALRETNRKILELDRAKNGVQAALAADQERLKAFADIPAKEIALATLKAQLERLGVLEEHIEKLSRIHDNLEGGRLRVQSIDAKLAALARYDWAWSLARLGIIQQRVETLEHLANVRSQLRAFEAKLRALDRHDWSHFLARLNRIGEVTNLVDNTTRIRVSLQPIQHKLAYVAGIDCVLALGRISTIASVMEIGERLRSVRLSYGMITGQEATLGVELAVSQDRFMALPDQPCVTCGRPIDKATREQHLKETTHA